MRLNHRNDFFVLLVATFNRLRLLKMVLDSIIDGTQSDHEIIVIDGGSTDGTQEFLQNHSSITPVFQNKLLGTARCYNEVWKRIESKYTCWLSDDTELSPGILDKAITILEAESEIGMVGLKMRDVIGPGSFRPYRGGLSEYGILNCNHGVLRTDLLKSVGYFNEDYRSYTIDPDLTASILCTGQRVVVTKEIGVLHHREWSEEEWDEKMNRDMAGIDNFRIYSEKFEFLLSSESFLAKFGTWIVPSLLYSLFSNADVDDTYLGLNFRDWRNLIGGRFIRLFDPLIYRNREYYLNQIIPNKYLCLENNPYRHLVKNCST